MGRVQYGSKKKLDRTKQNSAERKTKNQATFGNNCFLIQIHLWHEKKKRWTKSNRELGAHCTVRYFWKLQNITSTFRN